MRLDQHAPNGTVPRPFLFVSLCLIAFLWVPSVLGAPGAVGIAAARVNTPFAAPASTFNEDAVVLVLPNAINGNKRFSRLVLHNTGLKPVAVILVAHSRGGKREEKVVQLGPGAVERPIVATLFPRFDDFTLQLLARGELVTMALENWPAASGGGATMAVALHGVWDPARWTVQAAGFRLP